MQFDKEGMTFPKYQFILVESNSLNFIDDSKFNIERNMFTFIHKGCRSFMAIYETLNGMIRIGIQPRFPMERRTDYGGNKVCLFYSLVLTPVI